MIQKIKGGYILDDGTQVMFLNREQEKRFNREQYELRLEREYNTFLEKENTSHSLYGINALQEWGSLDTKMGINAYNIFYL